MTQPIIRIRQHGTQITVIRKPQAINTMPHVKDYYQTTQSTRDRLHRLSIEYLYNDKAAAIYAIHP